MRIVAFAYHDIGCEALRTLVNMGEEVVAVFTHKDDPKEKVWFGSVESQARSLNISAYLPENPNQNEWIRRITEARPDIIFSFYYREIICDAILKIPPKGAFNLHGSLLPRYRGRAPVNWVLVKGEKETGLTLHYMVKEPDAGDIVAQKNVRIDPEDTALTLYKKLIPLTREILEETVPLLSRGAAPRIRQNPAESTYFGGRTPEDGRIHWTSSAEEIYNLIRAVTRPYPGAFAFLEDEKIMVWKARITTGRGEAGTVISESPLVVACGQGALELEDFEFGKKIYLGMVLQ